MIIAKDGGGLDEPPTIRKFLLWLRRIVKHKEIMIYHPTQNPWVIAPFESGGFNGVILSLFRPVPELLLCSVEVLGEPAMGPSISPFPTRIFKIPRYG